MKKLDIKTFTYDLIDSKMYVILGKGSAVIIDPNISEAAAELLHVRGITDVKIILTHEHYDHISGLEWFRERFVCTVYCSEACDKGMRSTIMNGSKHFNVLFIDKGQDKIAEASTVEPITCTGDVTFCESMEFSWEGHKFFFIETPGHSPGSICILLDDKYIFTGDSLLKDIPVITRLPGGSRREYADRTLPLLESLDKDIYVYPGHGESGRLKEFNI